MAKDRLTKQYLKAWGKKDTPTGYITDGDVRPGQYQGLALVGWTLERPNRWPVVILRLALLKSNNQSHGGMLLSMPFTPKTERHVCGLVEGLGWDGRVWPYKDHGWPEGTDQEEPMLTLLKSIDIGATLTFPPSGEGSPTVKVNVAQRAGVFSTAPFYGTAMPKLLQDLRELAADPSPFKSDWSKTV